MVLVHSPILLLDSIYRHSEAYAEPSEVRFAFIVRIAIVRPFVLYSRLASDVGFFFCTPAVISTSSHLTSKIKIHVHAPINSYEWNERKIEKLFQYNDIWLQIV